MMNFKYGDDLSGISLHNHSDWSDGHNTMEEMCIAARDAGIRCFGLSDHWVKPPKPGMDSEAWSMKLDRLPDYVEALAEIRGRLQTDAFRILTGLEVDFFYENYDEVVKTLSEYKLDYLIGSVHYSDVFPIDHDASDWDGLSQKEIDEIWHIYWDKLLGTAKADAFQIIGHLDLPKKFAFMPSYDYTEEACKVLDAIAASGKAMEVNTAGWFKACKEAYPSNALLLEARRRQIPILVSADAHYTEHVTRNFDEAWKLVNSN